MTPPRYRAFETPVGTFVLAAKGGLLAAESLDRLARDRVQAARPDVIAERPPGAGHIALVRGGQRRQRRVASQPLVILGQDAIDLRLLQHHLRNKDVVRVGGAPPRKIAAVGAIPRQQRAAEALSDGRLRQRGGGHRPHIIPELACARWIGHAWLERNGPVWSQRQVLKLPTRANRGVSPRTDPSMHSGSPLSRGMNSSGVDE